MLGTKWPEPAFWLPKVQGVTQVLAYFPLTLGREMVPPALQLPKVTGQRRYERIFRSPQGEKWSHLRYSSLRSGGSCFGVAFFKIVFLFSIR